VQRENEPQGGMSRTWLSQGRKIIQFRWRMRRWSGPCEAHLGFSPPTEKDRALSAGGGWIKQKMLSGSLGFSQAGAQWVWGNLGTWS
jgi:hypothetical protein